MGAYNCFCIWTGISTQPLTEFCELTSSYQQQFRKLSSPLQAEPSNFLFSVTYLNSWSPHKKYVVAPVLFYLGFIFPYIFPLNQGY